MKSRTTAVAALLALPLAACGASPVVPTADEAHTMACRGYVLTVGSDDAAHVKQIIDQATYLDDGIDADPVLAKIRAAAASAGSTAGLSETDFARFRTLVVKLDALNANQRVLDDGTTQGVSATAMQALSTAVARVHKLCY